MESINIKALVEHAAVGEQKAFEQLYEHVVDRVFAFVSFRTKYREDAREITQDVFIELHKALPRFTYQSDVAFYSYLFTIVRRQLATHYEKDKHKKHITTEVAEESLVTNEPSSELTHSVRQAIENLDDVSREIVILHHWSRFTFAEIGNLINMTESAVRVRHHRARSTLADMLKA